MRFRCLLLGVGDDGRHHGTQLVAVLAQPAGDRRDGVANIEVLLAQRKQAGVVLQMARKPFRCFLERGNGTGGQFRILAQLHDATANAFDYGLETGPQRIESGRVVGLPQADENGRCLVKIAAKAVELAQQRGRAACRGGGVAARRSGGVELRHHRVDCGVGCVRCGLDLGVGLARREIGGETFAHRSVESADLGVDPCDQGLDRAHGLVVHHHSLQPRDGLPQGADPFGGGRHAVEALHLALCATNLGGRLDDLSRAGLHVHRQLECRHADADQAVQHGFDLAEAHQRQEGRPDGQRRDQPEGDQQPAADAVVPGAGLRSRIVRNGWGACHCVGFIAAGASGWKRHCTGIPRHSASAVP